MGHHQHHSCPLGKKKKTGNEERQVLHSLSPDPPALAKDLEETDSEDDYGEDEWDPHASTKPSPFDGEASDEHWDPGEDMEGIESEAFNVCMIQMLLDLQDDDPCDQEWKLKHKQKISMKNG